MEYEGHVNVHALSHHLLLFSHFSPPAISGSHTLQHPPRKHEMMAGHPHPHQQQNMRTMGTHTLGRLPSHNHSPTHLAGRQMKFKLKNFLKLSLFQ